MLRGYTPWHLLDVAGIAVLFVIALQLREIKHLQMPGSAARPPGKRGKGLYSRLLAGIVARSKERLGLISEPFNLRPLTGVDLSVDPATSIGATPTLVFMVSSQFAG